MSNGKYKMTKEDKEQVKLFDVLIVSTTIECDKNGCEVSATVEDDPLSAAEDFWHDGWRVNRQGFARCPQHAPKEKPIKKQK